LESKGKRLLIDCGGDARYALKEMGLGAKDIDALYVSHCHADHIGGIEWLGFSRYFARGSKPELYVNERLAGALWNDSLRGGMGSAQGVILRLDDFFSPVHRIVKNGKFAFGSVNCRLVQTVHYMDGYEIVPSYGLLIRVGKKELFLTTDTQFCPNQISDFYQRADVIFQDCETAPWKSGVHAHYTELKTLPPEVRAKMWLYHYQDGQLPDAEADGFAGFIKKGQSFEFADHE
jgi:ribonuclease BN (tRNA processing enzyme)